MTVTLTERVINHLLKMQRAVAHTFTPSQIQSIPEFQSVKANTLTQILKRFRARYPLEALSPPEPMTVNDKIALMDKINADVLHKHHSIPHSASNDDPPAIVRDYVSITEDVWEKCLLELVNTAESMTTGIIDKIRDYLDKKGAIQAKKQDQLPIITKEDTLEFSDSDSAISP